SDSISANLELVSLQGLRDSGSELGHEETMSIWAAAEFTSARRCPARRSPKVAELLWEFLRKDRRALSFMISKAVASVRSLTHHPPNCSKKSIQVYETTYLAMRFGIGYLRACCSCCGKLDDLDLLCNLPTLCWRLG